MLAIIDIHKMFNKEQIMNRKIRHITSVSVIASMKSKLAQHTPDIMGYSIIEN